MSAARWKSGIAASTSPAPTARRPSPARDGAWAGANARARAYALAEAESVAGRTADAMNNFKLARAEIQIIQATGVVVDVDLALFEADHGDPAKALAYAENGYRASPTVRAADALAWALHRLGRDAEAKRRSDQALRLGSRDPLIRYHAGAIAATLGRTADARRDLELALSTDPGFSATGVAEARRILATLAH